VGINSSFERFARFSKQLAQKRALFDASFAWSPGPDMPLRLPLDPTRAPGN
jgi:hypothetical protein